MQTSLPSYLLESLERPEASQTWPFQIEYTIISPTLYSLCFLFVDDEIRASIFKLS